MVQTNQSCECGDKTIKTSKLKDFSVQYGCTQKQKIMDFNLKKYNEISNFKARIKKLKLIKNFATIFSQTKETFQQHFQNQNHFDK